MNQEKKNIKMNLTINEDFFQTLKYLAERNHLKVSTWVKQFLMQKVEEMLDYEYVDDDLMQEVPF